jgi:hypothetical protein
MGASRRATFAPCIPLLEGRDFDEHDGPELRAMA